MSRNGSGTYNLPSGNPVVTATTITSTWANTTLSDIATALTGSLAADGQTPATGNLNMNTNQIKNVVDPTLAQDAATKAYVDVSIPSTANFLTKTNNLSDVSNATTARGNLTAAKSGANSDITSITGLTTALSAAQGGTGLTAPGTSGNVLTSNGTAWTSVAPASNVSSATAGNGVAVSGSTGAVTFSAACPTFNSVGSYCFAGCTFMNDSTFTAGSNYSAGSGNLQINSLGNMRVNTDGTIGYGGGTGQLSGTWKWMTGTTVNGFSSYSLGLACRVS